MMGHHGRDPGDEAASGLARYFLRAGVVVALIGLAMGIGMGAAQDFRLATAHAHLNLLGWVSMILYGLFYTVAPSAAQSRLAVGHALCATVGLLLFTGALALLAAGPDSTVRLAHTGLMIGPLFIFVGMVVFAYIVFRATRPALPSCYPGTPPC